MLLKSAFLSLAVIVNLAPESSVFCVASCLLMDTEVFLSCITTFSWSLSSILTFPFSSIVKVIFSAIV